MDIGKLEAELNKSQDALSANASVKPGNDKLKKKRGHTHKHLTIEEEKQYMVYSMVTDLFQFEELKSRPNFAIKRYKESLYRGELVEGNRHGQGICVYEIGRIYEGDWLADKRDGKGYERFSNGN